MGIELTPEELNTLIDSWGNSPLSLQEIVGKVAEAQLKKLQDLAPDEVVEEIARKMSVHFLGKYLVDLSDDEQDYVRFLAREIASLFIGGKDGE